MSDDKRRLTIRLHELNLEIEADWKEIACIASAAVHAYRSVIEEIADEDEVAQLLADIVIGDDDDGFGPC